MLCVAMKEDAILKIGDDIVIYVQHVGNGQVRLAVKAPKDVDIEHLPPKPAPEPEVRIRRPARR